MPEHISNILPFVLNKASEKVESNKFKLIRKYSKRLTKSHLKELIMNTYAKGVFTSDEVTFLFTMYELRAA